MNDNNKIAFNTVIMYIRLFLTIIITLLSSRWILLALGEEDFGIYNLVAGMLSLLTFLNLSLSTASQRFLSFALGKNDVQLIADTFCYSIIFHFVAGIIIVLLIELFGTYLLNSVLQVPLGKMYLALFCLHCLTISTFVTIIAVPFNAILLSYENIIVIAIVETIAAILKLAAAIFLLNFNGERLELYAIIVTIISSFPSIFYCILCLNKHPETHFWIVSYKNKKLFKEFAEYASWNLIGSTSSMIRDQGIPMLLNSFYGVSINAAFGLANQVKGQLSQFSTAILTAARPQIVKSEGAGNRQRTLNLSATTSKITFLLLSTIAVPLIVEMPYVLELWLKKVPTYTISFTRWIIVISLIFQFAIGISMAIESVGKIRSLQLCVGTMHFFILPLGYIMLMCGSQPSMILFMMLCEECLGIGLRLYISKKNTGLKICNYLRYTLIPSVISVAILFFLLSGLTILFPETFLRFVIICICSIIYMTFMSYYIVLTNKERKYVKDIILLLKKKYKSHNII